MPTPQLSITVEGEPHNYEVIVPRSHPKFFLVKEAIDHLCAYRLITKLQKRSLLIDDINVYTLILLDIELTSLTRQLTIRHDPVSQSIAAKRGREFDNLAELELEYRSWRSDSDSCSD